MHKTNILIPCAIASAPKNPEKAIAAIDSKTGAISDLLYMESVLVSTGSNSNDDVFLKNEMWRARQSPVLKPVDWEHNTGRELTEAEQKENPGKIIVDSQTIGVMYNTYVIDDKGVLINEESTKAADFEIPDDFHIVDEAVIWKGIYPSAAKKIEEGAQNKTLFVSMEAWFTDYDYVVGNKIVARNENTAFLENSLRANGGDGVYGNSRVRRALKNITFGGKGIVARPANAPSIITKVSHEPICAQASENNVILENIIGDVTKGTTASITTKGTKMSEQNIPLALYTEATKKAASLEAQVSTKEAELTSASTKIAELEAKLKEASTSYANSSEAVLTAFQKGAELIEAHVPGFTKKVAKASPENFFNALSEIVEGQLKVEEDIRKELEESKSALAKVKEDARTAARKAQVEALFVESQEMSDEEKKKKMAKKEKMMAAVKAMSDEEFAALYEVLAEDNPFPPKKKGEKPAEKPSEKTKCSEDNLSEIVAQLVASLNAGKKESDEESLTKAVSSALEGEKAPTDEENLMAILKGTKAATTPPPAGSEQQGFDLDTEMSSLVADILKVNK